MKPFLFAFIAFCSFSAFGQASVVTGSITTSKTAYTVGLGKNRLIVVAVTAEIGAGVSVSNITWGGQSLTLGRAQQSGNVTRTEIWYLNEAGISAARGSCTYNFIVTWSSAPANEVFAAFTLKDIDQTTPVAASNSAQSGAAQTRNTGNVAVGVNDIMVYASSSGSDRTHTPAGSYTEHSDQIIGGAGGASMATASRAITVAGNENPTATWTAPDSRLISVGVGFNGVAATNVITYYSRNVTSGGQWDDPNSWTLNSDGTGGPLAAGVWPTRTDNVVIRAGHTITVNATDDNKQCGVSPDGLGQPNIGPFVSSNLPMFYHTGDITISGTLTVTGIEMMIGGYTRVLSGGTLGLGSNLVQVGYLEVDAGSTFSSLDDLVLTGNSVTIINTNSTSTDDLIVDHTNATLCGSGTATLQNGSGSQVTFTNSGTLNQICTSFTVNCTGGGCTGFPVVGTTVSVTGITGPAGVGSIVGNSFLKIWFKVDNGLNTTGTTINSWTNSAGIAALDISEAGGQRPTLVPGAINGFSEVSFSGSNRLRTGLTLTTSNFITNQASTFMVNRADNTTQTSSVYLTDPLEGNRFSNHIPWAGTVYYDIGNCCGTDARMEVGSLTGLTGYSIWSYDANPTTGKQLYRNGTQLQDRAGALTYSSHATHRFNIGGNTTGSNGYVGDVTEVIIYNARINQAQRILIQNYLSAKYAIALTANDVYTQDDVGNGDFDYNVSGIGQAGDGSRHIDAQGAGIVRMRNPNNLANNEYLIWGHDAGNLAGTTSGVDGVIILQRINRIWRVSETGDVGTVSISFDLSGFAGAALGGNLRLLIDRDGDGFADNDVTPISAGSFASNVVTFSGVNLQNGDRFTLGNTDLSTPLPIELLSFTASVVQNDVVLKWATATETNNHYFNILRSSTGEDWETIGRKEGAGTSVERNDYELVDTNPLPGVSYYRLKQTDTDGTFTLSTIRRVEFASGYQLKAYPNPTSGKLKVTTGFKLEQEDIRLLNTIGQPVPLQFHQLGLEAEIEIKNVPAGIYILQVHKGFWQQSLRVVLD